MYIVEYSVSVCGMIGVTKYLVDSTLTVDIKLFVDISDVFFISFVSNAALYWAKTQSLKSTVTYSRILSGIYTLSIFKLSGISSLANFYKVHIKYFYKSFWHSKSNLKDRRRSKLQLTLFCKTFSVSTEVSVFWNTISIVSWLYPLPKRVFRYDQSYP